MPPPNPPWASLLPQGGTVGVGTACKDWLSPYLVSTMGSQSHSRWWFLGLGTCPWVRKLSAPQLPLNSTWGWGLFPAVGAPASAGNRSYFKAEFREWGPLAYSLMYTPPHPGVLGLLGGGRENQPTCEGGVLWDTGMHRTLSPNCETGYRR